MESSRMIMPEHRQAWIDRQLEKNKHTKPIIDEQEMQLIERALVDSFNQRERVDLILYDPFEDRHVSGIVSTIDTYKRQVKLITSEDDFEWIKIKEIVAATL
ncbi:YolD-like family protein [Neobacillus mesonae]|nr:YolD-like family protein [Neobacillus mesonae]